MSAPERDLDVDPYRPDEARVVAYLHEIAPSVGAGDDPIGFLIASHHALGLRLAEVDGFRAARPSGETPLPRTDLPGGRHVSGDRDPRCGGRPHP